MKIFKIFKNHFSPKQNKITNSLKQISETGKKATETIEKVSNKVEERTKPFTYEEIGLVKMNENSKYVPEGAQKYMYDPDVSAYYWHSYWETTPEGKKIIERDKAIIEEIKEELRLKQNNKNENN